MNSSVKSIFSGTSSYKSAKSVLSRVAPSFVKVPSQAASSYAPSVTPSERSLFRLEKASLSALRIPKSPKSSSSSLSARNLPADRQTDVAKHDRIASWASQDATSAIVFTSKDSTVGNGAFVSKTSHLMSTAQSELVARTKNFGTWGGQIELIGLARMLMIRIRIVRKVADGPGRSLMPGEMFGERVKDFNNFGSCMAVLAFDGTHYDALVDTNDTYRAGHEGQTVGRLVKQRGDGDCLYHSVAYAADLPMVRMVQDLHQAGQLGDMIKINKRFRAMFDDIDSMTHDEVRDQFRKMVVMQIRHELSRELSKPQYAKMADMSHLGETFDV
jgi:hypothetical protein